MQDLAASRPPKIKQMATKWSEKLPKAVLPSASSSFQQHSASNLAGTREWPFASQSKVGLEEAFQTFAGELAACDELDLLIAQGEEWIHRLYSYRCISRALPSSKDESHYRNTFDLLKPKMLQLLDLIQFCDRVEGKLKDTLQFLLGLQSSSTSAKSPSKRRVLPRVVLGKLISLIDVMVTLDHVKDMKTPWINDFSQFKRAFDQLKNKQEELVKQIAVIQTFLTDPKAPRAVILTHIKTRSLAFKHSENVLLDVFAFCLDELEAGHFCAPEEHFRLLRFLSSAMFLLDGTNEFNAFRHKRVNSKEVKTWFHLFPILPLFADLHISVVFVLEQCPNFKILIETKPGAKRDWIDNLEEGADEATRRRSEEATRKRYELQTHWQEIRKEFDAFGAKLALLRLTAPSTLSLDLDYVTVALEGLQLLSKWKGRILLQAAFKFSKGSTTSSPQSPTMATFTSNQQPFVGTEYDRVGRENYKPVELHILFDVICLIKSLAAMLLEASTVYFALPIRRRVHFEVQDFAQLKLLKICQSMHSSKKKQSSHALQVLNQLRTASVDWLGGPLPDLKTLAQQSKNAPGAATVDVTRAVGPSPNQLVLIRCFLEQLLEKPETNFLTSWISSADFDQKQLDLFRQFHSRSFFFPYLLGLNANVKRNSDLGVLWHREFYLDMTKQVQFPIESSLPWIVTKHVLDSGTVLIDSVLFFLDIYNDAAHFALDTLRQGHLFDEIEGEAMLVFEQFVFLLTDHVYTDFKAASASRVLEEEFKLRLHKLKLGELGKKKRRTRAPNVFFLHPTGEAARSDLGKSPLMRDCSRYESILSERAFQFLGRRDIDLNRLIGDGINAYFRQDLMEMLTRFESHGLTSSREVETMLMTAKQMHDELQSKGLGLDDFTLVLEQLDERVASNTIRSRIMKSAGAELVSDVLPNFAFNSLTERFIRSPTNTNTFQLKQKSRVIPPNFLFGQVFKDGFQKAFSLEKEFVGLVHVEAMLRVSGFGSSSPSNALPVRAAFVCNTILDRMRELVGEMAPLLKERVGYMEFNPPTPLATPQYFAGGQAYAAFDAQAKQYFPLLHPDRGALFQRFREFGNGLALVKLLSTACDRAELDVWSEMSVALGLDSAIPPPLSSFMGDEDLRALSLPNSFRTGCILANAIHLLSDCITKEFAGFSPSFYRVFSLMQFSFASTAGGMSTSQPPREDDSTELGDGFLLCGHFILSVLGQKERFDLVDACLHATRADALEKCWGSNGGSEDTDKLVLFTKCVRECIDPNRVLISSLFSRSLATREDEGNIELFHPFSPERPSTLPAQQQQEKRQHSTRGAPPPPPPPPPAHVEKVAFQSPPSLSGPPPPPPPPPRLDLDPPTVRRASMSRAPPPPVPQEQPLADAPKRPPRARTIQPPE
ncbi:hypothetical protein BASA81_003909 [Batrachochytrium salamandrivorans]|nr:hypothetical protein BASA81_003909 [Batrachochytrium salamandrivorans]